MFIKPELYYCLSQGHTIPGHASLLFLRTTKSYVRFRLLPCGSGLPQGLTDTFAKPHKVLHLPGFHHPLSSSCLPSALQCRALVADTGTQAQPLSHPCFPTQMLFTLTYPVTPVGSASHYVPHFCLKYLTLKRPRQDARSHHG